MKCWSEHARAKRRAAAAAAGLPTCLLDRKICQETWLQLLELTRSIRQLPSGHSPVFFRRNFFACGQLEVEVIPGSFPPIITCGDARAAICSCDSPRSSCADRLMCTHHLLQASWMYHLRNMTVERLSTLLAVSCAALIATASVDVWPQRGLDSQHSGRSTYQGTNVGAVTWSADQSTYYVQTQVAIGANGVVFSAGWMSTNAYNGSTGSPMWSTGAPWSVGSSPALSATLVIQGCDDSHIFAYDRVSGTLVWSYLTGGNVQSSPVVSSSDTLFVGSNDNKLYALQVATGALKWSYSTSGSVESSPALSIGEAIVYVGSDDSSLHAVYAANGTRKWIYTTGDQVQSSPAVGSDGTIYVGSNDGAIY